MRFFRERRISPTSVDLAARPLAPTELRRFTARNQLVEMVDRESRAFQGAGLGYMRLSDDELFERLLVYPALLRLPLVRWGNRVSVGLDEQAWRAWLAEEAAAQ
ncbi:hypothetical protein BH24CHL5_BH24CHL5_05180 [soil metagenome]